MKKIIHLFWSFTEGGAEHLTCDLISNLSSNNYEHEILVVNNLVDQNFVDNNFSASKFIV